jgi:hypothetical protein
MFDFRVGHATHPDWRAALALAGMQIDAGTWCSGSRCRPAQPGLRLLHRAYAPHAAGAAGGAARALARRGLGGQRGVGVCASGVEYFDEPALVLMLRAACLRLRFEVFSGARKLQRIDAYSALVHADPATPELAELIDEMSDRTGRATCSAAWRLAQGPAVHVADGVWQGGLSGVAFTQDVALVSRVTQGCQPLGPTRTITACERNMVTALDGQPALPCCCRPGLAATWTTRARLLPRLRATLVGLTDAHDIALARPGQFGTDTRVRHLIGLDPGHARRWRGRDAGAGHEAGLLRARRGRRAARPGAHLQRDPRRSSKHPASQPAVAAPAPRWPNRRAAHARARSTSAAPAAAGRTSAALRPNSRSCSTRWATCPWRASSPAGEIARHHLYGYTGVLTVFTGAA